MLSGLEYLGSQCGHVFVDSFLDYVVEAFDILFWVFGRIIKHQYLIDGLKYNQQDLEMILSLEQMIQNTKVTSTGSE